MKILYLFVVTFLLCSVFVFSPPASGAAIAAPTSVHLYDIEVFKDLLVTDDFLAIVPYNIPFAVTPDININLTFIFSVLSPDGATVLGTVTAYPRYTKGYGKGIVSFYIASGMVWESAYIFRVQENPAYYFSPQSWDFSIGATEYSTITIQKQGLRAKIIDSASELSTEWSVDLLTNGDSGQTVLSTYGELYYPYAIPGLQAMCPELFSVQIETPNYTKRSWSFALANALRTKYAGTVIDEFMTGFAGMFSMEKNSAMDIASLVVFIIVILISVIWFKASLLAAFTDGYVVLELLMLEGFVSMVLVGFIAFFMVLIGGMILLFNR